MIKGKFLKPARVYWVGLVFLIASLLLSSTPFIWLRNTVQAEHAVEAALVLDLNGPDVPETGFALTFVEDEGPRAIVASELEITSDTLELTAATITLDKVLNKSEEILDVTVDLSGTNITKSFNSTTGILKLEGKDTVDNYEAALRTATYNNLSDAPDTADRTCSFVIKAGAQSSAPANSKIAVSAVNDAPLLDNTGDMRLDSIFEDDQSQIGNDVAAIIASAETGGADRISDPDLFDPEGIAVIEVGDGNGIWEFSIDAGTTWESVGAVNNSSALLLEPSDRLRFLPALNFGGQTSIIFRAWDQSSEAVGGDRVDASVSGGTTPFSLATESATIDVLTVDDPPFIDLNGALPGADFGYAFLSQNTPVRLVAPDAFVGDLDSSNIISMAVTLKARPDGPMESLIASYTVTEIIVTPYNPQTGTILFSGAAAIDAYNSVLRGLNYLNAAETITPDDRTIEFRASDGSNGSQPRFTLLKPILANNAPVLDTTEKMTFVAVAEDTMNPEGESVGDLLDSADSEPINDADLEGKQGFAVVAANNSDGEWQFSVDQGGSWLLVGDPSDSSALLLDEAAMLRFVPDVDFSGETRTVSVRAWDQTEGSNGLKGIDVSTNGGATAFSTAVATVPIFIEPSDDPPVLTVSEDTIAMFTEGKGPVVVAGPALQIVDVDTDNLQSATIAITNMPMNEPDILGASTNDLGIAADFNEVTGSLELTGEGTVAEYQAILRSITFDNLSRDPDTSERIVSFRVSDGTVSSNTVSSKIVVTAVNDPPLLDLNGEAGIGTAIAVYYDEDASGFAPPLMLATALQIQDVDNTTLTEASVYLAERPDGPAESLRVDTAGTNITAAYSEEQSRVRLSGRDSLAAYQQVLRSATYNNGLPFANRAIREVTFAIQDASMGSAQSTASIIVRPQYTLLPIVTAQYSGSRIIEEPNNSCEEALPLVNNWYYEFGAEDINDWFSFTLREVANTTVELTGFAPEEGQLLVAEGICGSLKLIGHNGDFAAEKVIQLGARPPGRYYIWLINDGPIDLGIPYHLRVSIK